MKVLIFILSIVLPFCAVSQTVSDRKDELAYLTQEQFMNLDTARSRWGHDKFDPARFRAGSTKDRSSMIVSLIEQKLYLGKPPQVVIQDLGPITGHFWNDTIPTYILEEGWDKGSSTWQVVFLLDQKGQIMDVRIHRNCC